MKKMILLLAAFLMMSGLVSAQHIDSEHGKTFYDAAKTKLKEVYNYKEINEFSVTGNHQVVEVKQIKHGPYFYYYEDGKIKISGQYKDDKKHGIWKYYDESGQVIKQEEYKEGELVN